MSTSPTRVLLVDDESLIRAGLRVLVESVTDLVVVGEAADGAVAIRQAAALRPDVVLMDLRMPGVDGVAATRAITTAPDATARVLVVTTFDDDDHVLAALRGGASGFILKDTPPQQILDAIRVVAAGDSLLDPGVTSRLIARLVDGPSRAATPELGLTPREQEVFALVAHGRSNAEIAAELHLGRTTVKTHVSRLLDKLGARDRVQLVVAAYETGTLTPAPGRDRPTGTAR